MERMPMFVKWLQFQEQKTRLPGKPRMAPGSKKFFPLNCLNKKIKFVASSLKYVFKYVYIYIYILMTQKKKIWSKHHVQCFTKAQILGSSLHSTPVKRTMTKTRFFNSKVEAFKD